MAFTNLSSDYAEQIVKRMEHNLNEPARDYKKNIEDQVRRGERPRVVRRYQ